MDAPVLITVQEAADELELSAITVRHHIASGQLPAVKRGGAWWLDAREVARMRRQPPGSGRPLDDAMAWAVILIASGSPERAAAIVERDRYVSRANAWVRQHTLADHASRLRSRARTQEFDAHPAELVRIGARDDVLLTGLSAGDEVGLVGATTGIEIYAPAGHRTAIVDGHALDEGSGPVRVRWIRDELWPLIAAGDATRAPRAAVLLDLLESDDPRARREAEAHLRT